MIPGGAGVLLAGGRSRRFGADKRISAWRGRPLALAPLRLLQTLFPVVMAAVKDASTADFLSSSGARLVEDGPGDFHPLAGLIAALEASPTERVFVLAADMPLVRPALIRRLWSFGGTAVIPSWKGVAQPFCAAYGRGALPALRRLRKENAPARAAAKMPGARLVSEEEWRPQDPAGLSFVDVDTREDLARARILDGKRPLDIHRNSDNIPPKHVDVLMQVGH